MIEQDPWMIKILEYLMKEDVAHTAQIARHAHMATTTANKYLRKLLDEGFVVMNKLGVGKPVYWTIKKQDDIVNFLKKK
ncbi:winged helix-turn-helix domain-containing protein [Candidatus Undinarchaeota archaeon]